jgi:hypothetical protein
LSSGASKGGSSSSASSSQKSSSSSHIDILREVLGLAGRALVFVADVAGKLSAAAPDPAASGESSSASDPAGQLLSVSAALSLLTWQQFRDESPMLATASQVSKLQQLYEQQVGHEGDQQQQVLAQRRAFGAALAAALPSAVGCNALEVGDICQHSVCCLQEALIPMSLT